MAPRAGARYLPRLLAGVGALGALLLGVLIARDPKVGIAVAAGACYAPLVFINLPLGIALWTPLVFFERVPLAGPGPTVILILIAVAWLGALPSAQQHVAAVLRRHAAAIGLTLGFFAWTTASIIWATDESAALHDLWTWVAAGGIFLIIATTVRTPRVTLALFGAFVLGALASEVVSFIQGPASDAELAAQEAGRLGAGGQDPNYLAAGLVPGIVIGLGLIRFTSRGPLRLALIATVIALVVGVVATGSRGGFLALLLAVVVGIIISRGRRLQLAIVVAVVIAVGSFWFSTGSLERVKSFDSGTGRVDLWRVATEMSADHPVIGVGINNFQAKSLDYALQPGRIEGIGLVAEQPDVAHNTYLQQLAETGIIGLALLIGALIASMRASWNAIRKFEEVGENKWADLARSVLVSQVAILAASIFLSNGNDRRMWLLLSFGIVLTSVATRMRGSETAA